MDNSYIGISPVISMAGVMPGNSQMIHWNTAFPNPDDHITLGRIQHGVRSAGGLRPSLSIAGVMPAGPQADSWVTANPCPDEEIRQAALRLRSELARRQAAELPRPRRRTQTRTTPTPKAA